MVIASVLPLAGVLTVDSRRAAFAVLIAEIVAFGWLIRDPRASARRLGLGLVAAVSVAVSTWFYGGYHVAETATAGLRIVEIVLPGAVMTPLIRPSELGDHLAQRLRLPPRVVVAAVVALQRVDAISKQWRQVQDARRSRGMGFDGGPRRRIGHLAGSAFALLVVSMRDAGQLAIAMDVRGFAQATQRTWAEEAPWRFSDSVACMLAGGVVVVAWLSH